MIKQGHFLFFIYHKVLCYYNVVCQNVLWLIAGTNGSLSQRWDEREGKRPTFKTVYWYQYSEECLSWPGSIVVLKYVHIFGNLSR